MAKDILKFHAIYWPAFLLAAGLQLPKQLISHAFWTVNKVCCMSCQGENVIIQVKMSKSLGNVVNPVELIDKFGLDPVRYFLLREGSLADDGDFSEEKLFLRLKGDLADNFGNLLGRCTSLSLNPNNILPTPGNFTHAESQLINMLQKLPEEVDKHYRNADFVKGLNSISNVIVTTNQYFSQNEPWKLKPKKNAPAVPQDSDRLSTILYTKWNIFTYMVDI